MQLRSAKTLQGASWLNYTLAPLSNSLSHPQTSHDILASPTRNSTTTNLARDLLASPQSIMPLYAELANSLSRRNSAFRAISARVAAGDVNCMERAATTTCTENAINTLMQLSPLTALGLQALNSSAVSSFGTGVQTLLEENRWIVILNFITERQRKTQFSFNDCYFLFSVCV